jgi:tetratricopeptide (TPR) repeat protein
MTADWQTIVLEQNVLREGTQESNRIVLWLPVKRERGFQFWERVGSVANAEISFHDSLCAIAATSVPVKQRVRGLLYALRAGFWRKDRADTWVLPNGDSAEQCGERQTDLLLVWPANQKDVLDDGRVQAHWPHGKRFQRLGQNLYLVSGIESPGAGTGPESLPHKPQATDPQGGPREQAEYLLAVAVRTSERRGEALALTDLGILALNEGQSQQALAHLERALLIARQLADRSLEADVLGNLGLATLRAGQLEQAQQSFQQALMYARGAGDRFGEKLALQRLGQMHENLHDPVRAAACFEDALTLARAAGDHQHEAALLWHLAIQHAERGRRDQAIILGQATIDLLTELGKPEAGLFADHLQQYYRGETGLEMGGSDNAGNASLPGHISRKRQATMYVGPMLAEQLGTAQAAQARGPGLLRMALSAALAMGKFLGSGLKTASRELVQQRLHTCAACEHHTGVRCRICGCFTQVKARLPHEDCPIGKWRQGAAAKVLSPFSPGPLTER